MRRACGNLAPSEGLQAAFVGWAASCVFVYSALFGVGLLLMGHMAQAAVAGALLVVSGIVMGRSIARMWNQ